MGKKPFIDRKTAKHFQVVHRSQRDARIADAESSPYVLKEVPISANIARQQQEEEEEDWTSEEESASESEEEEDEAAEASALDGGNIASEFGFSLPKQKKHEAGSAARYGILYDDTEYDYTQHLRPTGQHRDSIWLEAPKSKAKQTEEGSSGRKKVTFTLPEEALPSAEPEAAIGLMNQPAYMQGLQPDLDEDIKEALFALEDDSYLVAEHQGDLPSDEGEEDNLLSFLTAEVPSAAGPPTDTEDADEEDEWAHVRRFKKALLGEEKAASEESQSDSSFGSFSQYRRADTHVTSASTLARSVQETILDDRFEKLLLDDYEDSECGSLNEDAEDIQGKLNPSDGLARYEEDIEAFIRGDRGKVKDADLVHIGKHAKSELDFIRTALSDDHNRKLILRYDQAPAPRLRKKTEVEEEVDILGEETEILTHHDFLQPHEKWDCQTAISHHSNLYNRPKKISVPKKDKIILSHKTGIPIAAVGAEDGRRSELKIMKSKGKQMPAIEESEDDDKVFIDTSKGRAKEESKEEKKRRKEAVKEERRERRAEKKKNTEMLKKSHLITASAVAAGSGAGRVAL